MNRCLTCLFFLLTATLTFTQSTTISLKGLVRDSSSSLPLSEVNIAIQGVPFNGTTTDLEGNFSITVEQLPATIIVSSIGYLTRIITIKNEGLIDILLQPTSFNLSEIIVRAKPKVDTVFHEPYNVVDYIFSDDQILLLVYKSVSEKYELVLMDEFEQTIDRLSLKKERPISLFKSCLGNLYLNTTYKVFRLRKNKHSVELGEHVSEQVFDQSIKPCLLARDSLLFYQRYFYQGQAIHFYSLVMTGSESDSMVFLPMIEDDQQIIRLIEAAGYRLPWSGDFWDERISGGLQSLRDGPYVLKGKMRMFFPKLYVPVFSVGDDLCIINHLTERIQIFDSHGNLLRETPIDYHRSRNWKKILFQDEANETIYTVFHSKWGEYICPIDLKTGALKEAVEIDIDFTEKATIRDGVLYFIHRNPYAGIGNRTLKKVRLNL